MSITFVKGDLLKCNVDAIVNTVNTVGVMGKGIALQFKHTFPDNFEVYRNACLNNEVITGKMFVFKRKEQPKFIINFPTKQHWRNPSKIEWIEKGLQDLIWQIFTLEIKSIAIPALGCANGGLDWNKVRPIIINYIKPLPNLEAFVYEPH